MLEQKDLGITMNNSSINTQTDPYIKSWFGFFMGLIFVSLSLFGLVEDLSIQGILATLGFLCFWYPFTQLTGWRAPLKSFFDPNHQKMSKNCNYLTIVATALLIISTIINLTSKFTG